MQKLNAHGKLVLGLVLAMTAALPLACGSDDSKGIPQDGDGGEAGEGGSSAGKGGGSAGKGGATEGGGATVGGGGGGGATEAGAPAVGGEGGATEPMGGAGGAEETAGAGGDAGDTVYAANLDAACTTEGSLNCSTNGAASDKQDCIGLFDLFAETYPPCFTAQKALVACLASKPVGSFECTTDDPPAPTSKIDTCATENTDYGSCLVDQPQP
jgi:hypothetical protein